MRAIPLLFVGTVLAACSTSQPISPPYAAAAARSQQLLAGKVAGPPMDCISSFHMNDMVVLDDNTIGFRQGANRVYVNRFEGGCHDLTGPYALVTREVGEPRLCRGDIVRLVDPVSHTIVGSCVFGDFIPYKTPGT